MSQDAAAGLVHLGGLLFGALMGGCITGLLPAILGALWGRKGLAIAGFLCCVFGSLLLGILLAIPVAIIFAVIILILGKRRT